ncbi:hypothetical protein TPA0908_34940 [Micromonospora sp. AKA38]|nr:hypothetical protein TPA0908_34940 [Micromonospora sp. AKA38]
MVNLGCCVPVPLLASEALSLRPELVALSSVNGHGYQEGVRVAERLRAEQVLGRVPLVIGGKLGLVGRPDAAAAQRLRSAGFDDVYDDENLRRFTGLLRALHRAHGRARSGSETVRRCG